jgi:Ca2+-binding RTX toxin-like protein
MSLVISEILFNSVGTDDLNEYVELRGEPGTEIPQGTYLIGIEGDQSTSTGQVQMRFDLSGLVLGEHGFLVLLPKDSQHQVDPNATMLTSTTNGFGGLPNAIFKADGSTKFLENASVTFMLIQSGTVPTFNDDIDSNDDGIPDGDIFASWMVLDSVGIVDESEDKGYGAINFLTEAGAQIAGTAIDTTGWTAGYVGRIGNSTGDSATDWVAGYEPAGSGSSWALVGGKTTPGELGLMPLNHLGTVNFDITPPAIADLSPTHDATQIAVTSDLILEFNEVIQPGTGTITLYFAETDAIATTVDVSSDQVTITGTTVTIDLAENLAADTQYAVAIEDGAFLDLAGNFFRGIQVPLRWLFSTGEKSTVGKDSSQDEPESRSGGDIDTAITAIRTAINSFGKPVPNHEGEPPVSHDLNGNLPDAMLHIAVRNVDGGNESDVLVGCGDCETIHGWDGRDFLFGMAGDDLLYGDRQRDSLYGGVGCDQLYGGEGCDRLFGMDGNDRIFGDTQADLLRGGSGDDVLRGGQGGDRIMGGTGDDRLDGGAGRNMLCGGEGRDQFICSEIRSMNLIRDFSVIEDVLNLSGIWRRTGGRSQSFTDLVQVNQVGSRTVVAVDPNGAVQGENFVAIAVLNRLQADTLNAMNFVLQDQ